MPARVPIPHRVVPHIRIPVQALQVARGGPRSEVGERGGLELCGWQGAGGGDGDRDVDEKWE